MYLHSPVRVRNICGILEDKNIMRKILSRLSWYLYLCKYLTYGLNVYAHVVHTVCIDITYILLKSIKWTVKISEMTFLFPFLSGYVITFLNMFVSFWLYLYHSGFIASFWWYIHISFWRYLSLCSQHLYISTYSPSAKLVSFRLHLSFSGIYSINAKV